MAVIAVKFEATKKRKAKKVISETLQTVAAMLENI